MTLCSTALSRLSRLRLPVYTTTGANTAGVSTGSGVSVRPEESRHASFTCAKCGAHMACTVNNAAGHLAAGKVQTNCMPSAGGCGDRKVLAVPSDQLGTREQAAAMRRTALRQCAEREEGPCNWCTQHAAVVQLLQQLPAPTASGGR